MANDNENSIHVRISLIDNGYLFRAGGRWIYCDNEAALTDRLTEWLTDGLKTMDDRDKQP